MESFSLLSCRMCLCIPGEGALTFSVSDTFKGRPLREMIEQLFGIKISKEDFLTNVCVECMDRINTVRAIYQQFIQSNENLKQLLEKFKEESEEVEVLVIDEIVLNQNAKQPDDEVELVPMKNEPVDFEEEPREVDIRNEEEIEFLETPSVILDDKLLNDSSLAGVVIDSSTGSVEVDHSPPIDVSLDIDPSPNTVKPKTPKSKISYRKIRLNQQIPNHKCYFCKTVFETELAFTEHLHVHFAEVPLVCEKCDNIVFKSVRQASKHLALHDEDERPHKCRICELRFFTRENSLTHERKIHRLKVKIQKNIDGFADKQKLRTFHCKFCGQSAPNNLYLKKHELTHGPPPPTHACEVCGKEFTARKNLTRHLMIHTGELPYKCEICERAFRQAGDLKDHIRSHTKEKPYMCNSCGLRFRNISMLHVHRKKLRCVSDE